MNQDIKHYMKVLMMITMYISLGVIGIYSSTLIFLVPLLMAPMSIYLMGSRKNYKRDLLMHAMIACVLYFVTRRLDEALLYIISVVVPSHILVDCYRRKLSTPHIAIYTGIGTVGMFYLYIIGMKYFQMDYVQAYNIILDTFEVEYIKLIEKVTQMSNVPDQTLEQIKLVKEQLPNVIDFFKYTYPAMLLVAGVLIGLISTIIITLIGKVKKWRMPSLAQFVHFKFSRWMAILLVISGFIIQASSHEQESILALGINLYYFISYLLQLIGIVTLIVLIKRSNWSSGLKMMSILLSIMMFWSTPFIVMIVGLGDTLFNFRKVDITV